MSKPTLMRTHHRNHVRASTLLAAALAVGVGAMPVARAQTAPEQFVPRDAPAASGTLELRVAARVPGSVVLLRHLCRWSDADDAAFAPIADLTVDHLDGPARTRKVTLADVRATLAGAGVNLAFVRFAGATACLVSPGGAPEPVPAAPVAAAPAAPPLSPATAMTPAEVAAAECNPFHSLRDRLVMDASQRLNVPVEQLQVQFAQADANLLNMSEPAFHFQVGSRRVRDLGKVEWDVTVSSGAAASCAAGGAQLGPKAEQKVTVAAEARAWQNQIVMARAATYKQVLQADDISERRVLVDHLSDDAVLTRKQVVGQQAARDLRPGIVLTARLVDAVPLAHNGEAVRVTLTQGGVRVTTVGTALESGSFGQTIKVKNEQTKETYEVTLTGPQVASMGATAGDANLASLRDTHD